MSCTKRFLNFEWQHHRWRPRVMSAETLIEQDSDVWARTVYRDYIRCDKHEVCEECGAVRREQSCFCDIATSEKCPIFLEWRDQADQTAK